MNMKLTQWRLKSLFATTFLIAIIAGCAKTSNMERPADEQAAAQQELPAPVAPGKESAADDDARVPAEPEMAVEEITVTGESGEGVWVATNRSERERDAQALARELERIQTTVSADHPDVVEMKRVLDAMNLPERASARYEMQSMAVGGSNYSLVSQRFLGPPEIAYDVSSLSTDEELWVIAKPATVANNDREDGPGSGAMVARFPEDIDDVTGAPRELPLPLQHTDVNAVINGYISTVDVTQQFRNPFDEKIEAVYMFPLPEKAAVSEFLMVIGERKIRGILREKEEAEQIYREARAQGYSASLLVQHRPNVFEQKVANIEPGKAIDVDIRYFHTLAYNDGWYSFVFPTVVGPRYNPPGHNDPIRAVPSNDTTEDETGTAVRYLRPNERSAHDISINVEINAGVSIEEFRSTHQIVTEKADPSAADISLADVATMPNKDFVLDFRVAGSTVKSNLLTYVDPASNQGYFTLMMYPPASRASLARQPMELVFVLDCSGSMRGRPLDQAKAAVSAALDHLNAGDTFQIIRFSDNSSRFGNEPVPATPENVLEARKYLATLNGSGGTQMIEGVKAALDFPHDPTRLRFVSFMTDGFIGNEKQILEAVHDGIGESRIFSFGVGTSVNRYLMERMARAGKGAVAYLAPSDPAADIMSSFFERISHPALTNVDVDWGSMAVTDVYPSVLPDLFVGRAVVVTGKFLGGTDRVTVHGSAGGVSEEFYIEKSESDAANAYVSKIWARLRIADLSDRQSWEEDPYHELTAAIRSTALEYQLMSDYTSFVAVDTSQQTAGSQGTTIHQAVPVPDGVRYETTVQQRQ